MFKDAAHLVEVCYVYSLRITFLLQKYDFVSETPKLVLCQVIYYVQTQH